MKRKIPLFSIYWDEDDVTMITNVIKTGMYWTTGPNTASFEKMIADYLGATYCLVFCNGTAALHAILAAYEIGAGDEVIVPSFTFIATANAALFVGAKPVFADIEQHTFGLDPEKVEKLITPRTKAIMPIHFGGCPCFIRELKAIADAHKLILIEDAAEAFGAMIGPQKAGTVGQAAILSFCQNKIITTGEGGAVVTNNKTIYDRLKLIRSHGRLDLADYFSSSAYMDYVTLGYNFRLSDISSALGIAQIKKVAKIIQMRQDNAHYLSRKLAELKQVLTPEVPRDFTHVYQMYTVRIKGSPGTRDSLIKHLEERGITAKVNFYPVHLTKFYREKLGHTEGELPVTESVSQQVLTLPMYPALSSQDMDFIAQEIGNFFTARKSSAGTIEK